MTDIKSTLDALRKRLEAGEDVPDDELRAALAVARSSSLAAAQETRAKKQPARSAEDLLAMLATPVETK